MSAESRDGRHMALADWKRRDHYELYRGFARPFFSICAEVDATKVWTACESGGPSFFIAIMHFGLRAANSIEALRTRPRDDGVFVHECVGFSTTVLRDDQTFAFALLMPEASMDEFELSARETIAHAKLTPLKQVPEDNDGVIYHSTIPWVRFSAFSNPIRNENDYIPRIVFGKCSADSGRWMMPVGVEAHHSIVDGIDVGRFFETFQAELDAQ